MNEFIIIINENIYYLSLLKYFHHTTRQTCLTCLHLSVLCIYDLHNN